jgi:hypothetical protein
MSIHVTILIHKYADVTSTDKTQLTNETRGKNYVSFTGTIILRSYSDQQWLMFLSEKSHSYLERFKDLSVVTNWTTQTNMAWESGVRCDPLNNRPTLDESLLSAWANTSACYTAGSTATEHFATVSRRLYTLLTQPLRSSTNSNDSWIKPEKHALHAFSLHQIFEIHLKWVHAVTLRCHTRIHEHSHLGIIHTCMHTNQFTFQILAFSRQKKFKTCNKYITTSTYFIEDMDEKLQAV